MRARLFCPVGELKGADFEIRGEAILGRGTESTIRLPSRSVSTRHARIAFDAEAGHFLLEDLGSLNGTQLDGAPVKGVEALGPLHVITFGGKHEMVFQDLGAFPAAQGGATNGSASDEGAIPEGTWAEQAPPLPPMAALGSGGTLRKEDPLADGTLVDQDLPGLPSILAGKAPPEVPPEVPGTPHEVPGTPMEEPAPALFLEIRSLTGEAIRHSLAAGDNVVGRDAGVDVQIPYASVSRRHAVVEVGKAKITVRDLGSRNGTFVGGEEVSATEAMPLAAGAVLRFGNVEAVLVVDGRNASASESNSGEELS